MNRDYIEDAGYNFTPFYIYYVVASHVILQGRTPHYIPNVCIILQWERMVSIRQMLDIILRLD
jgi:hypothetical protein